MLLVCLSLQLSMSLCLPKSTSVYSEVTSSSGSLAKVDPEAGTKHNSIGDSITSVEPY
jgi:hypothetical protein